jgi:hypothetical protein
VKFFDTTILLILLPNVSVSDSNHQTHSIVKSKSCHKLPYICTFLKRPGIPGSLRVFKSIFRGLNMLNLSKNVMEKFTGFLAQTNVNSHRFEGRFPL